MPSLFLIVTVFFESESSDYHSTIKRSDVKSPINSLKFRVKKYPVTFSVNIRFLVAFAAKSR